MARGRELRLDLIENSFKEKEGERAYSVQGRTKKEYNFGMKEKKNLCSPRRAGENDTCGRVRPSTKRALPSFSSTTG